MKPVLNFQIPADFKISAFKAEQLHRILENLRSRLCNDYEIVITPWQLQAENMINVSIGPETDIEDLIRRLQLLEELRNGGGIK